jgi:murein L,D-transpeptidase YafK
LRRIIKISAAATLLLAVVLFYPLVEILLRNPPLPGGTRVSRIIVVKSEKRLYRAAGAKLWKSYPVALVKEPGPKQRQGERRTPEGVYESCRVRQQSKYNQAIYVTYPNAPDRARGRTGGDIEIHGLPPLAGGLENFLGPWIVGWRWTEGCIMLRNQDMDEIVRVAATPLTVEIRR